MVRSRKKNRLQLAILVRSILGKERKLVGNERGVSSEFAEEVHSFVQKTTV